MIFVHSHNFKETASTAALYSTSTGIMSSIHGISHKDRALLALILEARYDGEVPPRDQEFKLSLQAILTPEKVWWAQYIGEIGALLCQVYPAGIDDEKEPRLKISSEWAKNFGKEKDKEGLRLILSIKKVDDDPLMLRKALEGMVEDIEKVGKRKNWVGGEDGWGMSIDIVIKEVKSFD
jgi:retrograde regulation protein 2